MMLHNRTEGIFDNQKSSFQRFSLAIHLVCADNSGLFLCRHRGCFISFTLFLVLLSEEVVMTIQFSELNASIYMTVF